SAGPARSLLQLDVLAGVPVRRKADRRTVEIDVTQVGTTRRRVGLIERGDVREVVLRWVLVTLDRRTRCVLLLPRRERVVGGRSSSVREMDVVRLPGHPYPVAVSSRVDDHVAEPERWVVARLELARAAG